MTTAAAMLASMTGRPSGELHRATSLYGLRFALLLSSGNRTMARNTAAELAPPRKHKNKKPKRFASPSNVGLSAPNTASNTPYPQPINPPPNMYAAQDRIPAFLNHKNGGTPRSRAGYAYIIVTMNNAMAPLRDESIGPEIQSSNKMVAATPTGATSHAMMFLISSTLSG